MGDITINPDILISLAGITLVNFLTLIGIFIKILELSNRIEHRLTELETTINLLIKNTRR
jgi:hypothetical protein